MTEPRAPVASTDPITGQGLAITFIEQQAPAHEGAKELLAYWSTCRARGDFVMGRDVPSRAISRLIRNLVVFERQGESFKFRLVGSLLIERLGRDVTGLLLSEVWPAPAAAEFRRLLEKVIATDAPVFQTARVRGVLDDVRQPEGVLLPMKVAQSMSACVLAGVFYW